MARRLRLRRWLSRKRISNLLFTSIFALTLTVSVVLGSAFPTYTQTTTSAKCQASPTPAKCKALVEDIKESAGRHFKLGSPKDVTKKYEQRAKEVGLPVSMIDEIYETEYLRLKEEKEKNLWEKLPQGSGWVTAAILFILLIFRDVLKDWITNAVKTAGNWFYNKLAGSPLLLNIALKRYQKALVEKHQKLHIPFRPNRPLDMGEVYVPLKVAGARDSDQIDAYQAIADHRRLMVKGPPGSGKSMLLRYIALSYAEGRLEGLPERTVPILLELHRLSDPDLTLEKFQQQLVAALDRDDFPKADRFVSQGLEKGALMLLLDGLDEVNSSARSQVVGKIKDLLDKYDQCRVIITCRTAVYNNEFAGAVNQTLEIVEFSDQQIRRFLGAWKMPAEKSIEQLIQTLRVRPKIMALARNPLLLTIIAYLYTDTPFVLPHSRAEFYQKATDILLEQWDQARQTPNKYRGNDKRRVLQHLALYAQDNDNPQEQDRRSIADLKVLEQIKRVLPSLNLQPENDTRPILDEIVERSGLLLSIDRGKRYQFAHLTLQEYFTAAALVDKGDELVRRFKLDPAAWREIVKLWCGLASNSTALIEAVYEKDILTGFECLADAQEVEQRLAETIINRFKGELGRAGDEEGLARAFGAVAADFRPRGKAVFQFLEETLAKNRELALQKAAAKSLSMTNLPKAVEVLANYYDAPNLVEVVREALVRMGDLAVPQLESIAEGGSENAMDALTKIGTPHAVKALEKLNDNPDPVISTKVAFYYAAIQQQQRNQSATEE